MNEIKKGDVLWRAESWYRKPRNGTVISRTERTVKVRFDDGHSTFRSDNFGQTIFYSKAQAWDCIERGALRRAGWANDEVADIKKLRA